MKTCCVCNCNKEEVDFYKNNKHKDGLQSICKECKKTANHQYYLNDKSGYIEKARLFKKNRTQQVIALKEAVGCKFCPEKDGCCLDYHHPDDNKELNVGTACRDLAWERVLREIGKCIIVCKNCHAKIHAGKLRV